jgi:hypothetical protein
MIIWKVMQDFSKALQNQHFLWTLSSLIWFVNHVNYSTLKLTFCYNFEFIFCLLMEVYIKKTQKTKKKNMGNCIIARSYDFRKALI